jgi:hypothetical protein
VSKPRSIFRKPQNVLGGWPERFALFPFEKKKKSENPTWCAIVFFEDPVAVRILICGDKSTPC